MQPKRGAVKLGRRPRGSGNPRADILRAAQNEFGERGFDRGSIRAIARRARVNPALVYHYFESKDSLFRESVRHIMRGAQAVASGLRGGDDEIGTLIVRTFLDRWSGGPDSMAFRGLLRSASTSEKASRILRDLIAQQVTPLISRDRRTGDPERRVALIASTLMGAGMIRFVIRMPALSTTSTDQVARWIGPCVTRYLQEPLDA